jgi:hypothetical protein
MSDPMEQSGEHIWLRQTITQTIAGQTRTLEIGVSVRPGMSADQIEARLREADAGMRRLSLHLESQVAAIAGITSSSDDAHAEPEPEPEPEPESVSPPRSAAPNSRPAANPVTVPTPPVPPAPLTAPSLEELSVPEFVSAARTELDLSPKQAMEKLNVKSLKGLNLREALEMLRRQSLGSANQARPEAPAERSAPPPVPLPTTPPHYFDEEDSEFEVTYQLDDDADPSDLESVPDFDAMSPSMTVEAGEARGRALHIVGQMRKASGGGAATSMQKSAYRNIIQNELGEQNARALVLGLWKAPVERLGAEQLDALLSWGKQETFGEEAQLVLAALHAERSSHGSPPASASRDSQALPPPASQRGGSRGASSTKDR